MGLQRVGHNWATEPSWTENDLQNSGKHFTHIYWFIKKDTSKGHPDGKCKGQCMRECMSRASMNGFWRDTVTLPHLFYGNLFLNITAFTIIWKETYFSFSAFYNVTNTHTTDTTHPSRRSTNPKYFSRTRAAHCRPLSKGCRGLPPADLPLKHLVLQEMEIANSDVTDKHRGWRILQLFPNKMWGSFFHFLKKKKKKIQQWGESKLKDSTWIVKCSCSSKGPLLAILIICVPKTP